MNCLRTTKGRNDFALYCIYLLSDTRSTGRVATAVRKERATDTLMYYETGSSTKS